MQAGPADAEPERGRNPLVAGDSDGTDAKPERGQALALVGAGRTAAAGRQEEEVRALLVGVTKETTVRIGPIVGRELIHPATLGQAAIPCLTNPGNYT